MKGLYILKDENGLDDHLKRCGVDITKEDKLTQNEKVRGWDYIPFEEVLAKAEWTQNPPRPYTNIEWDYELNVAGHNINLINGYYLRGKCDYIREFIEDYDNI